MSAMGVQRNEVLGLRSRESRSLGELRSFGEGRKGNKSRQLPTTFMGDKSRVIRNGLCTELSDCAWAFGLYQIGVSYLVKIVVLT